MRLLPDVRFGGTRACAQGRVKEGGRAFLEPFPVSPTVSDKEAAFRARACPRDRTPLTESSVAVFGPDVKVDTCSKCHGIYLDKNELGRLTKDADLNRYLRDKVGYDVDSQMICPSCGGLMDLEHAHGIDVEVCLTCFGIWLDAGELDALKASKKGAPPVDAAKQRELDTKRLRDRERIKSEKKKAGLLRPAKPLDDVLDEIVRRWL